MKPELVTVYVQKNNLTDADGMERGASAENGNCRKYIPSSLGTYVAIAACIALHSVYRSSKRIRKRFRAVAF